MKLDDQYFTMQVVLNFIKDNEISFESLSEAREDILDIFNEMSEEHINSLDELDEDVVCYMEETVQNNFIYNE